MSGVRQHFKQYSHGLWQRSLVNSAVFVSSSVQCCPSCCQCCNTVVPIFMHAEHAGHIRTSQLLLQQQSIFAIRVIPGTPAHLLKFQLAIERQRALIACLHLQHGCCVTLPETGQLDLGSCQRAVWSGMALKALDMRRPTHLFEISSSSVSSACPIPFRWY